MYLTPVPTMFSRPPFLGFASFHFCLNQEQNSCKGLEDGRQGEQRDRSSPFPCLTPTCTPPLLEVPRSSEVTKSQPVGRRGKKNKLSDQSQGLSFGCFYYSLVWAFLDVFFWEDFHVFFRLELATFFHARGWGVEHLNEVQVGCQISGMLKNNVSILFLLKTGFSILHEALLVRKRNESHKVVVEIQKQFIHLWYLHTALNMRLFLELCSLVFCISAL